MPGAVIRFRLMSAARPAALRSRAGPSQIPDAWSGIPGQAATCRTVRPPRRFRPSASREFHRRPAPDPGPRVPASPDTTAAWPTAKPGTGIADAGTDRASWPAAPDMTEAVESFGNHEKVSAMQTGQCIDGGSAGDRQAVPQSSPVPGLQPSRLRSRDKWKSMNGDARLPVKNQPPTVQAVRMSGTGSPVNQAGHIRGPATARRRKSRQARISIRRFRSECFPVR